MISKLIFFFSFLVIVVNGDTIGVTYTGWLEEGGKLGKSFDSNVDKKIFRMVIGEGSVIKVGVFFFFFLLLSSPFPTLNAQFLRFFPPRDGTKVLSG